MSESHKCRFASGATILFTFNKVYFIRRMFEKIRMLNFCVKVIYVYLMYWFLILSNFSKIKYIISLSKYYLPGRTEVGYFSWNTLLSGYVCKDIKRKSNFNTVIRREMEKVRSFVRTERDGGQVPARVTGREVPYPNLRDKLKVNKGRQLFLNRSVSGFIYL